ncbi:MAG: hypothetical protein IJ992_07435 [Lentisphaeria bacterium]|nr:hypothetical protein [Lentisphaeria bacterium]
MYVGNLPFSTTEQELRDLFGLYGSVENVQIVTARDTGLPRGFAFVSMDDDAAVAAIAALNEQLFAGRRLRVDATREDQVPPEQKKVDGEQDEQKGERPRRQFRDRGDRPRRSFRDNGDRPRRSSFRDNGDRPRRPFRDGDDNREFRPRRPFRDGDDNREFRPRRPFRNGDDNREFRPRRNFRDFDNEQDTHTEHSFRDNGDSWELRSFSSERKDFSERRENDRREFRPRKPFRNDDRGRRPFRDNGDRRDFRPRKPFRRDFNRDGENAESRD